MRKLQKDFYLQTDVADIARQLLDKYLVTRFDGDETIVRITETEAYAGISDKASHAYNGRRTKRTEVMFAEGGCAYVYLCYGIHHLFNVVTHQQDVPHAVLIRAGEPMAGISIMQQRLQRSVSATRITTGPGNLAKAMGITIHHSGRSLLDDDFFIAESDVSEVPEHVMVSPRIGVDYAGNAARWLYRFFVKDSPYVTPHPHNRQAIALHPAFFR